MVLLYYMIDIKDSTQSTPSGTLFGKKVLIIEDDVFLGGILLRHMIDEKIDAKLFTTGENAIENIKKDIPSILILDILLPGLNGLDILEAMRKDELLMSVPVIVVSNTDQAKDLERAKNAGAIFMLKALATSENIVDKIKEVLKVK